MHHVAAVPGGQPASPRLLQELAETLQRLRLGGPFYILLWLLAGLPAGCGSVPAGRSRWLHWYSSGSTCCGSASAGCRTARRKMPCADAWTGYGRYC